MTKIELVKAVANKIDGATQKDIILVIETVMEEIKAAVAAGEKVSLTGFGSFEALERSERNGRNPVTGEIMTIPSCKTPKFRPGKAFKDAVNA